MKNLLLILVGAIGGTVFIACSMGGKPRYSEFPVRAVENSVWMKCLDGDKKHACKYICTKYKRNNKCKKGKEKVVKLKIEKAFDDGFVLISKSYFLKLIRPGK